MAIRLYKSTPEQHSFVTGTLPGLHCQLWSSLFLFPVFSINSPVFQCTPQLPPVHYSVLTGWISSPIQSSILHRAVLCSPALYLPDHDYCVEGGHASGLAWHRAFPASACCPVSVPQLQESNSSWWEQCSVVAGAFGGFGYRQDWETAGARGCSQRTEWVGKRQRTPRIMWVGSREISVGHRGWR